jgi:hypothetical protein
VLGLLHNAAEFGLANLVVTIAAGHLGRLQVLLNAAEITIFGVFPLAAVHALKNRQANFFVRIRDNEVQHFVLSFLRRAKVWCALHVFYFSHFSKNVNRFQKIFSVFTYAKKFVA